MMEMNPGRINRVQTGIRRDLVISPGSPGKRAPGCSYNAISRPDPGPSVSVSRRLAPAIMPVGFRLTDQQRRNIIIKARQWTRPFPQMVLTRELPLMAFNREFAVATSLNDARQMNQLIVSLTTSTITTLINSGYFNETY